MPMMVVNDDNFELELVRLNTVKVKEVEIKHGRGNVKARPADERKLIAAEAICGMDVDSIRKEYNVSASSISAYKNGSTSTASYNKPNESLVKSNNDVKGIISERAEKRILTSLGLLNKEKMSACTARDLSGIAKDMSSIVKNMEPSIVNQQNNQVIIFKPRMKEEDDYEIIDVA